MTSPEFRSKFRKIVRDEMVTAYAAALTTEQLDALIDYAWGYAASSEVRLTELLRALVSAQRTWWDEPTLRSGG
ncbi:MAG: hypothetical protein M3332_13100 [Actinomycetota bacterium]|nr:hypothetical protein [Actinomycetota bacterium]